MHIYSKRASLEGFGSEIFKLVSYSATPEQWAEWLRVPLEHAAARGNLDLVNTLLGAGADGSAGWRGCRGRTLLDAAALGGSAAVVTALLQAGAQPDVNVVSLSPKRSALFVATRCGHEAAARRLVLAGADVSFEDPMFQNPVLHKAARDGHEQLVNELLIGGADPNQVAKYHDGTAIHYAACGGNAEIVSALLDRGANKDALDRGGDSALMWAADEGHLATVETLLAAGADCKIVSAADGCSALAFAARNGDIPTVKAILEHGADVNACDNNQRFTALHFAALEDRADAVDTLIEAGADVALKDSMGWSPLFVAAYHNKCKSMLALLKRGAAVRVHDNFFEETPLHSACYGRFPGLEAAVDLLLRWGADETASDVDGRVPSELLDIPNVDDNSQQCPQQELERARLRLARAPADRAWRRRCWLVMLRSRASKAREASDDNGDSSSGGSIIAVDRAGESSKVARTDMGAAGSVEQGLHGQTSNGGREVGGGANVGGLSGIVALLAGLELEDVFRTVVGFL